MHGWMMFDHLKAALGKTRTQIRAYRQGLQTRPGAGRMLSRAYLVPASMLAEALVTAVYGILVYGIALPVFAIWSALARAPRALAGSPRLTAAVLGSIAASALATLVFGASVMLKIAGFAFAALYALPIGAMLFAGRGGSEAPGIGSTLQVYMTAFLPMIGLALAGTGVGAAILP